MATSESDIFGADIVVGDTVLVACTVTAITPAGAGNGGSGDRLSLTVQTPGNPGEAQGVTFSVSPVQCRYSGNVYGGQ